MVMHEVKFVFLTGLKRSIFRNARLQGSWDGNGLYSDSWTEIPMAEVTGEDGCPAFLATVSFPDSEQNKTFRWGSYQGRFGAVLPDNGFIVFAKQKYAFALPHN